MSVVQKARSSERPTNRLRYFLPLALVAAASVFAFAALPHQMGGLISLVTVLLVIVIDRGTRRSVGTRPRGTRAIVHHVLMGAVYVGSLVSAVTVARDGAVWVAGLLSFAVLVVVAVGAWIPNRRRAHQVSPGEPGMP